MKHTAINDEPLNKNRWLNVGFGGVYFSIEHEKGRKLERTYIRGTSDNDQCTQVRDLEEEYGSKFEGATAITLHFHAPLWEELYEFNKEDRQWYKVQEGKGFA